MDTATLAQFEMPLDDSALIMGFMNKIQVWAPDSLVSIVLYGSIVKGFFPEDYDIDIVLLFSNDFDHQKFYHEVYTIIGTLKPHRKMHVVLKWVEELEPKFSELIEKEGVELYSR